MSGIYKTHLNPVCQFQNLLIRAAHQMRDGSLRIVHIIQRLYRFLAGSLSFPVSPFCFKHLDMCTVTKHDLAQIHGGIGRINISPEPLCIQNRKFSGVIDMCMCQQYKIKFRSRHRNRYILKIIRSLLHSKIHQKLFTGGFQKITASCNFMCRTHERYLHKNPSFCFTFQNFITFSLLYSYYTRIHIEMQNNFAGLFSFNNYGFLDFFS